ncbi:MAG: homoserine O-acetyltransferase [Trueperaceae bacterium]|nr:homoserine O-acetyltransferase [Trueperaceae bacterium]
MKERDPRRGAPAGAEDDAPLRLVHETWGDHEALLARTRGLPGGRVGRVRTRTMRIADAHDPLPLERGGTLAPVDLAYETYGHPNAAGDNAVLVAHALTGSAHAAGTHDDEQVPGWWDPLIGPGKAIDTDRFFVVSINVLGGCYGSTGPASLRPDGAAPWGPAFPRYTMRDVVRAQKRLLERLGVTRLAAVIGGSMGGMQVLEWAAMEPTFVGSIVPIASCARHSAWAIGLNAVARRAITADPAWNGGRYPLEAQPEAGLGLARAVAMMSYRSFDSLEAKFGRDRVDASREADAAADEGRSDVLARMLSVGFEIESYLAYQGVKLSQRFDANTYLYLTRAMDDHDLAEGRGPLREVLGAMTMPALVLGIDTDVLYPEAEQRAIAERLPNAQYATLRSPHGHDAFLIEFPQLAAHLRRFLQAL